MGPTEDTEEVDIDSLDSAGKVKIETCLNPEVCEVVIASIQRNRDVFAWSHNGMKGIDPKLMCHRLTIDPRVLIRR